MRKTTDKAKGIKKLASSALVLVTCAAFLVPTLLVIEAVKRLNEKESKTDVGTDTETSLEEIKIDEEIGVDTEETTVDILEESEQ